VLLTEHHPIILTALLVLLVGRIQCPELIIPVGLQRIGDKPVRRVDMQIPPLGQVRFVLSSLHCLLPQPVHLVQPGLDFLLNRKRDFQRERRHCVDEQPRYCLVNVFSEYALANRDEMVGAVALADVLRNELRLSGVVTNRHSAAAKTTDRQAL
jgi:hypothetical protein